MAFIPVLTAIVGGVIGYIYGNVVGYSEDGISIGFAGLVLGAIVGIIIILAINGAKGKNNTSNNTTIQQYQPNNSPLTNNKNKYCTQCGFQMSSTDKFCPNCGKPQNNT